MTAALIVAAGSASRMGFDKLLAPLGGEPVILWTLRAFQECGDIDGIWVVAGEERGAKIGELAAGLGKFRGIVPGGAERHHSVWNGLQALPGDCKLVAVHDGARPLIAPDQISRCVETGEAGGAVSARRVTETVKRVDDDGLVTEGVDRNRLWIMETPQVFEYAWLMEAYREVIRSRVLVTDEVSAFMRSGFPVWVVENSSPNPKITLPGDLEAAAALMGLGGR